jgi:hypothetical protein
MRFLDRDAGSSILSVGPLRLDPMLQQDRHHFIGLTLIEIGVEVDLAGRERHRAQRQSEEPQQPGPARWFRTCAEKSDQHLSQDFTPSSLSLQ